MTRNIKFYVTVTRHLFQVGSQVGSQLGNASINALTNTTTYSKNNPNDLVRLGATFAIGLCCFPFAVKTLGSVLDGKALSKETVCTELLVTGIHAAATAALSRVVTFPTLLLIGIPVTIVDFLAFYTILFCQCGDSLNNYKSRFPFVRILISVVVLNICYSNFN